MATLAMSSTARAGTVTPLQKVVQMLGGMLTKGKDEKHAEAVQYAAYEQFCDDTTVEKQRAISEAENEISMLTADIQSAEVGAQEVAKHIQELDANMATFTGDIKAATSVREIERTDYMKVHKDYSDSIDAIAKAVDVLQTQAYNRPQATALMQRLSALPAAATPSAAQQALRTFLAGSSSTKDDFLVQLGAGAANFSDPPEANAYEFRSRGVIDMLEKLRDKFVDERSALEKEELAKRHAFDILAQDLQNSIDTAKDTRSAKVQQKAKNLQSASAMKGDLADATSTKDVDTKYLSEITTTCKQKAADFKERQQLRADEITAIEKAIEILSSNEVAGTAEKYLPSALMQRSRVYTSLIQVRSKSGGPELKSAAAYLSLKAERLHSRLLSTLALSAREDPFAKVKKMITDMITRLMQQANEEAQHKGWCDTELTENEQTRTSRKSQVELLSSEIEQKNSHVMKLSSEITKLSQDLSDMASQLATMQTTRQEEKATNEVTVKDAANAQTAVGQAITVLKEFYSRAAVSTALFQKKQSLIAQSSSGTAHRATQPEIFQGAYTGMGESGVVDMLEVIQSDYARLESTTNAMEATAAW
jgi:hypothetical protein